MKKMLFLLSLTLGIYTGVWAQSVKGRVLDDSTGEGLPSVSITVSGVSIGTTTGPDGFFSLFVPADGKKHTLQISDAGYTTVTMPLKVEEGLVVRLRRESKQLEDVVIIGYQTVRRRDLMASVSSISSQDLKDIPYYFAKPPSIAGVFAGTAKDSVPPVSEATPQFRDIHISNVVCDGAEEGIFVRGLPEMNIRDIYLADMVLKAAKGVELAAAQQVHLANIRLVTGETDPVIYVENSSQLTFDHIGYNPGAALLFSINGDKCSAIRVRDTDGSKAVRNAAFQYGAVAKALELN